MAVETKILIVPGAQSLSDGVPGAARGGKLGDVMVSHLHPNYYEQAYRGNIFILDSDAVTLAAAHTTKGALATVKFINGFYNPVGSGVNAVIILANIATVSGTPAGGFFYNFITGITMSNAVTGTIRNALLTAQGSSKMQAAANVVLTIQGAGTTALTQLAAAGGPAAIAAGAGLYNVADFVEGKIIVPPGALFGITGTGAGTSHVVQSTLFWEEVAI